jgi:hypothetical protein
VEIANGDDVAKRNSSDELRAPTSKLLLEMTRIESLSVFSLVLILVFLFLLLRHCHLLQLIFRQLRLDHVLCVGIFDLELWLAADVCKTAHDTDSNQNTVGGIEGVLPSRRCKQWWRSKNTDVVVGTGKRVGTLDRWRQRNNTDVGGSMEASAKLG